MSRLIKQAKSSPSAFTKLYETHVNSVYQYCAYRTKSTAEAEDLTSEIWETALKHMHTLESNHPIAFKAWIFKIAQNCVYKHWKKRKEFLDLSGEAENIKSEEASPDAETRQEDEAKELRDLVETLPEQQKETIALRFFSELRNKEIATILGVSEKTVASNLSRGLNSLHKWLKKLQ